MLGMNLLRRREKKKKSISGKNPFIKKQHVLPEMEEDIIRNLMTRLEKIFGYHMKAHGPPKRDGLSHVPDNFYFLFYFLITLNDQSTL
jgi:hypothetical protein